jgi:LPS-assembly protein
LRAVGRWNYSLPENNILDALAGMEYGDCCWALRMVARHHRDNPEQETADNSVYLELELKGLASVGNRVNELLEEVILGYQPTRY